MEIEFLCFPFAHFTCFFKLGNIQGSSLGNILNYDSYNNEEGTYSLIFFFGPGTLDELRV